MSNNPVMNRNPYFQGQATTPNTYYATPNQGQYTQNQYGQTQYDQYNPQAQYAGAFADQQARPGAMTYDDAMVKTLILLAVAVVSGAVTMGMTPTIGTNGILGLAIVTSLAAFVIGMIAAFQKMVKPWLAIGYSLLEGIALGALTGAVDTFYPGIGLQAVLGTVIVVGVCVFLHVSGTVRTTPKGRRIVSVVLDFLHHLRRHEPDPRLDRPATRLWYARRRTRNRPWPRHHRDRRLHADWRSRDG